MGIRTHRGNKIENRTIEYWLNNPVYIGKIRWNPDGKLSRNYTADTAIISDGTHTPLIDIETWEKTQEKMKEQKAKFRKYYNPDRKDLSHWLTGIVRCEKCGAVLSNQGGFFGCSNKSRGICTGVGYISTDKLDRIILDTLSDVTLPNIKFEFAETEPMEQAKTEDESKIVSTQIQRLEIRLERVKLAYEEGIDNLEEYKANKKSILDEMDNLKKMLETSKEETTIKESPISKKDIRRLTALLQDGNISNTDKNKVARTIFKEIVKGGQDGKTLKCMFWR